MDDLSLSQAAHFPGRSWQDIALADGDDLPPGLALVQLFRPDGHDPDKALFGQMVLRPKPKDGGDFEVGAVVEISEEQLFADVPGLDPFLATVLDQDTDIMRWQREGMYASHKGAQTLGTYQEARIRHMHTTLDKYLEGLR